MSAAELFTSSYDAEFRLVGTYIIIGKMPLLVANIEPRADWKQSRLVCQSLDLKLYYIPLNKIPLSAMVNCPSGYCDGVWMGRAPARHRFQGLKKNSWWCVFKDGSMSVNQDVSAASVLTCLMKQPRTREAGGSLKGILTRDVALSDDEVLIRGIRRGRYLGRAKVAINPETPQHLRRLLGNARLAWKEDDSVDILTDEPVIGENPCAEILLPPMPMSSGEF